MCDTDFVTFLCHPLQNNNVKWPNSQFYVAREHTTVNFLFSTWSVTPSLQSQLPDFSAKLDRLIELKLSRTSLEVIFKVTLYLALPLWLLKLPFQLTTAPRKENESSREAMHLNYWAAAFELRANLNWDEMTSRIRGQVPKCYLKWRRPMTNFLLLWRGISLGSDALWKLKQRSVTQLSVVFLLVSTKSIQFLEWPPLRTAFASYIYTSTLLQAGYVMRRTSAIKHEQQTLQWQV